MQTTVSGVLGNGNRPSGRAFAGMAYDQTNDLIYLYGGQTLLTAKLQEAGSASSSNSATGNYRVLPANLLADFWMYNPRLNAWKRLDTLTSFISVVPNSQSPGM